MSAGKRLPRRLRILAHGSTEITPRSLLLAAEIKAAWIRCGQIHTKRHGHKCPWSPPCLCLCVRVKSTIPVSMEKVKDDTHSLHHNGDVRFQCQRPLWGKGNTYCETESLSSVLPQSHDLQNRGRIHHLHNQQHLSPQPLLSPESLSANDSITVSLLVIIFWKQLT